MIEVTLEPAEMAHFAAIELCCFCRMPTRYWFTPMDVACCQDCATIACVWDVPTKEDWLRRERECADREVS